MPAIKLAAVCGYWESTATKALSFISQPMVPPRSVYIPTPRLISVKFDRFAKLENAGNGNRVAAPIKAVFLRKSDRFINNVVG